MVDQASGGESMGVVKGEWPDDLAVGIGDGQELQMAARVKSEFPFRMRRGERVHGFEHSKQEHQPMSAPFIVAFGDAGKEVEVLLMKGESGFLPGFTDGAFRG